MTTLLETSKYLVDTLTLSSDTANDTWPKKVEYHWCTLSNVNSLIPHIHCCDFGISKITPPTPPTSTKYFTLCNERELSAYTVKDIVLITCVQGCLCFKHICLKHSFKRMFQRSVFKTYYALNIV